MERYRRPLPFAIALIMAIYFIAFDVAAHQFDAIRDAGGMVLAAAGARDLQQALDYLLAGKILAEQPEAPAARP